MVNCGADGRPADGIRLVWCEQQALVLGTTCMAPAHDSSRSMTLIEGARTFGDVAMQTAGHVCERTRRVGSRETLGDPETGGGTGHSSST